MLKRLLLGTLLACAGTIAHAQVNFPAGHPVPVGASQFALAVSTNTTLTIPAGAKCAQISVEVANVRYTDDGSSASTTSGQIVYSGQQFWFCGTLSALQFTAVTGSPKLNVSYYQ